jgi:hypothetical protein
VFSLKIRSPATFDFCNTIGPKADTLVSECRGGFRG